MIPDHPTHRDRRKRDFARFRAQLRRGRAERQQGRDRRPAALRRGALAQPPRNGARAAAGARRPAHDAGRRHRHFRATPPHAGAQSGRRAGAASGASARRSRAAAARRAARRSRRSVRSCAASKARRCAARSRRCAESRTKGETHRRSGVARRRRAPERAASPSPPR